MTNKVAYISGTAKWAKLVDPDEKYGGSWQLDIYPDEAGWKVFNSLNLELKVRDNEDGKFIKLRRPCQKIVKQSLVKYDPPTLVNEVGDPWDINQKIGNGSEVIAKISVYPTVKGNAHRLESVMITKLVEYNKTETVGLADDFVVF